MEKSLYEWLDKIEARPGLYLRAPGFASLTSFITGFEIALVSRHIGNYADPDFSSFGRFVIQRLKHHMTAEETELMGDSSWERGILAKTANDQEAFALFFVLLREFRSKAQGE
jgi:hypothetical protein